jgi:DMSO/TMAO reductase YedYZ heme-binding membrane subunit
MKAPEPYLVWKDPDREKGAEIPLVLSRPERNRWLRNGAMVALLLIVLPPFPYLMSPVWLLALVTGYAAAVLIAVLMVLPLRRLAGWPQTRLSVESHKRLGELALGLTVVHTALFLTGEALTLEYIWPSQPVFMIAGNAGFIILALLVVTSLERVRVRLFGPRLRFRAIHVSAAILLVVLTAAHMAGSGIFIAHPAKAGAVALISAALAGAALRRPREKGQPDASEPVHGRRPA